MMVLVGANCVRPCPGQRTPHAIGTDKPVPCKYKYGAMHRTAPLAYLHIQEREL